MINISRKAAADQFKKLEAKDMARFFNVAWRQFVRRGGCKSEEICCISSGGNMRQSEGGP